MMLGKIVGRVSTTRFDFLSTSTAARKYQFIQVNHSEYGFVLCQVVELERTEQQLLAHSVVIGFRDGEGCVRGIRSPFQLGAEVLEAEDDFIESIVKIGGEGAFLGRLEGKNIKVKLDLQKVLTKHLCVLAKSGAGKSYAVGVLLEEILDRGIPVLIIDPHGEYSSLRIPSVEREKLIRWGLEPQGYGTRLAEYGDTLTMSDVRPLKLDEKMSSYELMKILPINLSQTQEAVLFSVVKDLEEINFDNIILGLEQMNSSSKWNIIDTLIYLRNLKIFSASPTPLSELVLPGRGTIINLRGITPEIQDVIVYRLLKDLFLARKQGKIAPFFCVIEEAHNFCPEKGVGKTKSLEVIRLISSEGRKFGLGLCVVSQRPALVQKSILAQCSTQIIMKITNPNDLRAVTASLEGITSQTEDEIQNLAVGSALVCGIVDMPMAIEIRPRKSQHGGKAVNMLGGDFSVMMDGDTSRGIIGKGEGENQEDQSLDYDDNENFPQVLKEVEKFESTKLVVLPKLTIRDIELASVRPVSKITTYLIPAVLFKVVQGEIDFSILVDRVKGKIILDPDSDVKQDISQITVSSQFLRSAVYDKVHSDVIIDARLSIFDLKQEVQKKVQVVDTQECDIVYRKVEY